MDPLKIIEKYYKKDSDAYRILVQHSAMVAKKALEIARRVPELNPDIDFIKEAAMLHDIGMCETNAPDLDCHASLPYICHGYKGRELLDKEGLPKHALVCERHTGTGLSIDDINEQNLPIPLRDMMPKSVEEEIICLADKFYSKSPKWLGKAKTVAQARALLKKFGEKKVREFDALCEKYKEPMP